MKLKSHLFEYSSIKLSPDQLDPYDIPNYTFCFSQKLSKKRMSKPIKEDNDASLLAMENHLFDHLMDAMQDQSQTMYVFFDRHVHCIIHHLSNSCDNAQPLYISIADSISNPPHLNEPTSQETPHGDEISSTSTNSNRPTIQETPDGNEISITPPYFNALPIQETPDGDEIAIPSERNISP
jgi:hypothetical protein